jgi:cell division protease FtsH
VDLKKIAAMTTGFVGADLANPINDAALIAARGNADEVTMANFREAADRIRGVTSGTRLRCLELPI